MVASRLPNNLMLWGNLSWRGMCKSQYGALSAAFHLTCMGYLHRPQLQTLQDATWPGLVGLEDGSEPAVPLIRGTPSLYVARVMGNHTGVAGTMSGGIS